MTNNKSNDTSRSSYPSFFQSWDNAVSTGKKPGFFEPEELIEIIEIYITDNEIDKAKQAIDYALQIYSDNDELLYDILLLLNDFELWNDLLNLCEKYKDRAEVWGDGHKLTALLHLGMEDDAFLFFKKLKSKYSEDKEGLSIVYQAMGEALHEMDLYDSSIDVMEEAKKLLGEEADFYWIQLQSYVSLGEKEMVVELGEKIQKMDALNAETWHRLGIIYKEIDDFERSVEAFEYAQSLGYDPQQNLMNLIYAYEKNDNYNKALEKAKEYLNLYPDSYLVNIIAAKICSQIENWEEALEYIEEAIKLMPSMDSLYLYKSNFLLKLDESRKAKLALQEGINKTGDLEGDLQKELDRLNNLYSDI